MATLIQTKGGPVFFTNLSLAEAKGSVDRGEPIAMWWFAPHGQRYSEKLLISSEEVAYYRTESDDG